MDSYLAIADIYNDKGDYEKGFEFIQKHLKLSKEKNDSANIAHSNMVIGLLYSNIGDYKTAFDYIKFGSTYLEPSNTHFVNRLVNICYGNLFNAMEQYDSALYYYYKAYKDNPTSTLTQFFIAETYLGMKKYDTVLAILLKTEDYIKKYGEGARSMQYKNVIANAYLGKKNYDKALDFARKGLRVGMEIGTRQHFVAGYKLLSSIFKETKRPDSALFYFELYARMKDSVITDQLKGKLYEFKRITEDEKKLGQIKLLEQEKIISQQQLSQNRVLRNILIGGILFFMLLGVIVFRYISLKRKNERLKNEKIQGELQHKATDLEMQALRAQMNPHFIFNCLSSINRFILKNEMEAASDYLTRFSRLIRLVLIHSQSSLILLKDEIEMLRLYLDMEQMRF
jgi:tetratricopeptide (TPR) repeat protein